MIIYLKGKELVHNPILEPVFTATLAFVRSCTHPSPLLSGLRVRGITAKINLLAMTHGGGGHVVLLFWHHYIPTSALLAKMTMNSSSNDSGTFIHLVRSNRYSRR